MLPDERVVAENIGADTSLPIALDMVVNRAAADGRIPVQATTEEGADGRVRNSR